jgi:FtsZ-interacting cell division protein ZipA
MNETIITIAISFITSVVTAIITSLGLLSYLKSKKKVTTERNANSTAQSVHAENVQASAYQPTASQVPATDNNISTKSNQTREDKKKQLQKSRKEQRQQERRLKLEAKKELKNRSSQTNVPKKVSQPAENASFTYYTVSDGKLVVASTGQSVYYRAWNQDGKRYYQFFCESNRINKAINNHSSVIDPFCAKTEDSAEYDLATDVITDECGQLDANDNILTKTVIKFK